MLKWVSFFNRNSTSDVKKDVPISALGSVQSSRLQQLTDEKRLKTLEPVRTFACPPADEHHLTACLEYPGTDVTHHVIMAAANDVLRHFESRVVRVEFVARNVILGIGWCGNRWLITIDNDKAFGLLIGQGVIIGGDKIKCRPYDKVLKEEYKRYLENKDALDKKKKKQKSQLKATDTSRQDVARILPEAATA